jgi:hypothetical protein
LAFWTISGGKSSYRSFATQFPTSSATVVRWVLISGVPGLDWRAGKVHPGEEKANAPILEAFRKSRRRIDFDFMMSPFLLAT